jgi:hypothetical protein
VAHVWVGGRRDGVLSLLIVDTCKIGHFFIRNELTIFVQWNDFCGTEDGLLYCLGERSTHITYGEKSRNFGA